MSARFAVLISDLSIKRPVLATVISLLLIVLGLFAFTRLPLRELPDIDPPVVSIGTGYTGASPRWWKRASPRCSRTRSAASRAWT
jgi:multidrug efflux pump subunit AcrB